MSNLDDPADKPPQFVIRHGGVKRVLPMPFAMCTSRDDLELLSEQIARVLAGEFHYGWFDIHPRLGGGVDQPPIPWEQ